jgi:hypothetical protein
MKLVKILLAVIVLIIICFFTWLWVININIVPPPPPQNTYTKEIQRKIDSLSKFSNTAFCPNEFRNIQTSINEFHKYGQLGLTPFQDGKIWKDKNDEDNNDRWKDILSKNLYYAYSQKIVEQSMYVFNNQDWSPVDIGIIRREVKILKSSQYLSNPSSTNDSFNKIESILNEYSKIENFINSCRNFSFNSNDFYAKFPDVTSQIQQSKSYIALIVNHPELKNCKSLIVALNLIPNILFNKHVSFLTDKIDSYGSMYKEYNSQKEFTDAISLPLSSELDGLNNSIYGINSNYFEKDETNLKDKLDTYNYDAFLYFNSTK